jgi:hypothetical protein
MAIIYRAWASFRKKKVDYLKIGIFIFTVLIMLCFGDLVKKIRASALALSLLAGRVVSKVSYVRVSVSTMLIDCARMVLKENDHLEQPW